VKNISLVGLPVTTKKASYRRKSKAPKKGYSKK